MRKLLAVLSLLAFGLAVAQAQKIHRNDFGDQVQWLKGSANANFREIEHRTTDEYSHKGATSETITIEAELGSNAAAPYIHYVYPTPQAPVTSQLSCSVWMRAKHARLRRNRTPEQRAEQRVREATTSHAYHTRKRSAPGRHTAADLVRLCAQQGGRCAAPHCGASLTVSCTIDHKLPLSRGGSNYPDNLQLLCKSCNDSKSARTMDEWLQTRKETSNG